MTQIRLALMLYFFIGCPQSCMPNTLKGLPEVYEDMVEVLLVLETFLTEDSQVEDLLCDAHSYPEANLFFSDDLLCLWLQSVQYDLQQIVRLKKI